MANGTYKKTILCLANSWRPNGRCVAGKLFTLNKLGSWLRPINTQNHHAISEADLHYDDGSSADVLDFATITLTAAVPQGHQTENHVVDPGEHWEKAGHATWAQVEQATDTIQGTLWPNADSSYHGVNDKVPEHLAANLKSSLALIRPDEMILRVARESTYTGGSKRRIRGDFHYNGVRYLFVVTDPWVAATYFPKADGDYPLQNARICVSLAEVVGDSATKLIASVITPERVG